ncbi:MAG: putative toxin-antitoxin system toxin component, PIN family [Chloroflexi bacterium]|nr:putative toxin-antitoxin system toxin component, PIN family [Chloroflexota bacterium]
MSARPSKATEKPRAVLDTNVVLAAHRTRNPRSPNAELLRRWRAGEFVQLYSDDTLAELAEKFQEQGIDPASAAEHLADLVRLGEYVTVTPADVEPVVAADPDDDLVLACAVKGQATHLVTYDPHLQALGKAYRDVEILDGLHFLYVVRGDQPPPAEKKE